jgi:AcrR family transcriptional regulator
MSSESGDGRQRSPRGTLSRELIVAAAIRLADGEGLASLSMRRLAEELGVRVMSLYNHVQTKEDLLHAMVASVFAAQPDRVIERDGWKRQLEARARHIRALGQSHPWIIPLVFETGLEDERYLEAIELTLKSIREAGFDADETVFAYRELMYWAFNFVWLETHWAQETPAVPQPASGFPFLREYLASAEDWSHDERFEFGLKANLAGLESVLRKKRRSPAS